MDGQPRTCNRCGTPVAGVNFCPVCGARVGYVRVVSPRRQDALLGAALLQLLGWIGFLGLGYMARGRIGVGLLMLLGWWFAFWVLLAITILSLGGLHVVMVAVWLLVPPLSGAVLYLDHAPAAAV